MIHPTSEGSHMNEFPLNSSASETIPFLILNHRYRQGTNAYSSRDVKVVRESSVEESMCSGVCLT